MRGSRRLDTFSGGRVADGKSSRASAQRDVSNPWASRKPWHIGGKSGRSYTWARKRPCPDTGWEAAGWGTALPERAWGLQQMPGWTWANSLLLSSVGQTTDRAMLGWGKLLPPSTLWDLEAAIGAGPSCSSRRTQRHQKGPSEEIPKWSGPESTRPAVRPGGAGLVSLKKRRPKGDLRTAHGYLKARYRNARTKLISSARR